MNGDLAKERSRTTFNVEELSENLYGGKENLAALKYFKNLLLQDPTFDNSNIYFLSDEEAYEDALRKQSLFLQKSKQLNLDGYSQIVQSSIARLVAPLNPFTLHKWMFGKIIMGQGNEEQVVKWRPLIDNYQIIGTYAQTEMGHGTFVRGLETTATYNPKTGNFVLHSPTLTAAKWWPGSLGHTSTHAVVMARLITLGKDYGIHAFIVQLRSLEDHSVLPGRKLGFIGPKMGYKMIDNGFLIFNNAEIPRENMLMKYTQVSPDGEYSRIRGSEKLGYLTMVSARAALVSQSGECLARACTIAIRYSAVRQQSKLTESKPELQILDYKTQQYSLLPLLVTSYAFWMTASAMTGMYSQIFNEISEGDVSNAQELHATSAGLKAFTTQIAATGIETCRFRCGGHGYSMSSGLPSLYMEYLAPACTYEGENIVMLLQTARYLIKCSSKLASGDPISTPTAAYLAAVTKDTTCLATSPFDFKNPGILISAYRHRAASLVTFASKMLQKKISGGLSSQDAWNNVSVDLVRAAQAHCHLFVVEQFAKTLETGNFSPELRSVFTVMFNLYGVYGIVENARDFFEDQYMTGDQMRLANEALMELMEELRPNVVGLVDAFQFSDHYLNSVLGRFDGNVYEHLMKWAESFPMNRTEVLPAYEKYLRPLLKGKLAAKL